MTVLSAHPCPHPICGSWLQACEQPKNWVGTTARCAKGATGSCGLKPHARLPGCGQFCVICGHAMVSMIWQPGPKTVQWKLQDAAICRLQTSELQAPTGVWHGPATVHWMPQVAPGGTVHAGVMHGMKGD